ILEDLLDRGVALENAPDAVLTERDHTELDRLLFQDNRGRAVVDQGPNRVGDLHQFVNPFAPLVAGAVAFIAAFAVVELAIADFMRGEVELRQKRSVRLISCPTIGTNAPDQALPKDSIEGGRNEERFHPHVDEASDRARG